MSGRRLSQRRLPPATTKRERKATGLQKVGRAMPLYTTSQRPSGRGTCVMTVTIRDGYGKSSPACSFGSGCCPEFSGPFAKSRHGAMSCSMAVRGASECRPWSCRRRRSARSFSVAFISRLTAGAVSIPAHNSLDRNASIMRPCSLTGDVARSFARVAVTFKVWPWTTRSAMPSCWLFRMTIKATCASVRAATSEMISRAAKFRGHIRQRRCFTTPPRRFRRRCIHLPIRS